MRVSRPTIVRLLIVVQATRLLCVKSMDSTVSDQRPFRRVGQARQLVWYLLFTTWGPEECLIEVFALSIPTRLVFVSAVA